jgi:hypothetical protein
MPPVGGGGLTARNGLLDFPPTREREKAEAWMDRETRGTVSAAPGLDGAGMPPVSWGILFFAGHPAKEGLGGRSEMKTNLSRTEGRRSGRWPSPRGDPRSVGSTRYPMWLKRLSDGIGG